MLEAIIARNPTEKSYIEDVFSTSLYAGVGGNATVDTDVALNNTAEWSSIEIFQGNTNESRLTVDSSGNIYSFFQGDTGNQNDAMILIKFDPSGTPIWQKKIKDGYSRPGNVIVDSSGNVFISGQIYPSGSAHVFVAKLNSSGVVQWQKKLRQEGSCIGRDIALDSSGNVYVVGAAGLSGANYLLLAKLNSSGVLQWQRKISRGISSGEGIDIDSSDNIYITGYLSILGPDTSHMVLAKYNTSGTLQWQKRIQNSSDRGAYGNRIVCDALGNIYTAAASNDGTEYALLLKYNSSGTLQWQRKFVEPGKGGSHEAICMDSSGYIYVAGKSSDYTQGYSFVAKYDASGNIQWQRKIRLLNGWGYGIAADTNGNIFMSGIYYDNFSSLTDANIIVKLKQDGTTNSGKAKVSMYFGSASESGAGTSEFTVTATEEAAGTNISDSTVTFLDVTATINKYTQPSVTNAAGLLWVKSRTSFTEDHFLSDTLRGAGYKLASNLSAWQTAEGLSTIQSFSSTAFQLGSDPTGNVNESGQTYASWTFAKKKKFFDVVTYSGTSGVQTINHSLGSVPGMIIIKNYAGVGGTGGANDWVVYHRVLGPTKALFLNKTDLPLEATDFFNNTYPTSTNFTVGVTPGGNGPTNGEGNSYVAYLFAHDAGGFGDSGSDNVVSCGTFDSQYTPSINLGWEPQFMIVKKTGAASTGANSWYIFDNMRGVNTGSNDSILVANGSGLETKNSDWISFTSTGFTVNGSTWEEGVGYSSFVYMAIRRGPMRVPTDAKKVFTPLVRTGTGTNTSFPSNFPVDSVWSGRRTIGDKTFFADRLRGNTLYLNSTSDSAEFSGTDKITGFDSNFSIKVGVDNSGSSVINSNGSQYFTYLFRRAPGFFDIVCYEGNSEARTIPHNLKYAPELIFIKKRNNTANWFVYSAYLGTDYILKLNSNAAAEQTSLYWNNTAPTDTNFSLSGRIDINGSGNWISYLFASRPGISKIGSYVGNGSIVNIDCGFTNGARFVLIKRTDSTGNWYVWDTTRGIIDGNDPYISLNVGDAEVTTDDSIDPLSIGFAVNQVSATNINVNNANYTYLAIA